jgi:transmembrane 9 superfamily member 3
VCAVWGPRYSEVHRERGEVLHAVITYYAISSIMAGYTSGHLFQMYSPTTAASQSSTGTGGKTTSWQAVTALTVFLLPTAVTLVLFVLNALSLSYGTVNGTSFLVLFKLYAIWVFGSVPFCVVGIMLSRYASSGGGPMEHYPYRIHATSRPTTKKTPWYRKLFVSISSAGFISFGSIMNELYFFNASLWHYKYYHTYGFLLASCVILIIAVGTTSIIFVYNRLSAGHHMWQWTAYASGASTSAYIFIYGIYYYISKTSIHGMYQTTFYFGVTFLISILMGLMCGTIGYTAASRFVMFAHKNVKVK